MGNEAFNLLSISLQPNQHPLTHIYTCSDYNWLRWYMSLNHTSIESFMWNHHGVILGNHMTMLFAGKTGCQLQGSEFTDFSIASPRHLLQIAIKNLDMFCLVLIQERFEESVRLLQSRLSPQSNVPVLNRTVHDIITPMINKHSGVSKKSLHVPRNSVLYKRLARLNDLDMLLYEYALAKFSRDVSQMF